MTLRSRKHILFKKFCKDFVNITAIRWTFLIVIKMLPPEFTVILMRFVQFETTVILM